MIEVDDVILDVLRRSNDIAHHLGVARDFDAQRVLNRAHRGESVHHRADPTNPLGPQPGFPRIAIADDKLNPAKHRPGTPRIRDLSVVHLGFDSKMPFNASNWIYHHAGHWNFLALRRIRLCFFVLSRFVGRTSISPTSSPRIRLCFFVFSGFVLFSLSPNHTAYRVRRGQHAYRSDQPHTDIRSGHLDPKARNLRKRLVKRRHLIPKPVGSAGNTAMPRFHRPACPPIPPDCWTVVSRVRTFAAHFVKTPTLAAAFVSPFLDKPTRIVVRSTLALVVNNLAVGKQRAVVLVERRHLVEG